MTLYYLPQYKTTSLNVPGGITNSQTTGIILNDVTNVDTSKPGIIAISYSVPVDVQKVEYVSYTSINGSKELVGVTRGIDNFTAKSHNDQAVVAFVISASHINEINNTITANNNFMLTKALSEGEMINGKIVPSVSSNNLTVALKTLAGTDPSASDPVYVRIGDTVRTITSALSVDAAAGINWLIAANSETAGKEIDYFVYLGVRTSDNAILIGFSRIPYANLGSDFSSTSSERYIRLTGAESPVSMGNVVNIGRFAATLSASPSFNWSVPTFNATNLIQRPIFDSRWLYYAPVWRSDNSGSQPVINNGILTGRYKFNNETIKTFLLLRIGSTTSLGAGRYSFSLPFVTMADLTPTDSQTNDNYVSGSGYFYPAGPYSYPLAVHTNYFFGSGNTTITASVVSYNAVTHDFIASDKPVAWSADMYMRLSFEFNLSNSNF